MASNTIEITAALSPEYQAAFASAIDLVKKGRGPRCGLAQKSSQT